MTRRRVTWPRVRNSRRIQLKENPTTGYEWNATVSKGLAIISSDFTEGALAAGMVGVGGTRTWIIQANDLGAQSFNAIYMRSWEATTGNETAYSSRSML
jgi:inhibitor of cysteine peptidase